MSWIKVRLGDILTRRKDPIKVSSSEEYKLVTIRLYHKGVVLRSVVKGSEIKSPMSSIRSGDFILSGIDARNGAFGIVSAELDGAIVTNDFWCLDPDESRINTDFLLFLTTTDFFDNICKQSSDGTTQRIRLQKDKFFNYEISLPDIKEQRILVEKLKEVDSIKTQLGREIVHQLDLVQQLRKSFLREAMEGKLAGVDAGSEENQETGQQLLEKIKAEKAQLVKTKKLKKEKELPPIKPEEIPFEIPENWAWCRLGEVCTEILGGYAYDSSRYSKTRTDNQVIRLGNVKPDQLVLEANPVFIDDKYARETSKYKVKVDDILITMTGTRAKRDYLFALCLKENNLRTNNLYLNQRVGCLRFNNITLSEYINLVLKDDKILEPVFDSSTGAANQANIGNGALREILIPLPSMLDQELILAKATNWSKLCNQLEASIKQGQQQNEQLLRQVLRDALEVEKIEAREEDVKIIKLPTLLPEEDIYYKKRKALATYILNQSLSDPWLGDTKLMKLLHLADYHAIKRNLGQKFYQKAAGPFDNGFIYPFFEEIERDGWFKRSKKHGRFYFSPGTNHNQSLQIASYFSGEELSAVDQIIAHFKKDNYERPEIVSTLYAVWNNRIINGVEVSDALLKQDFLDWDVQKEKYKRRLDTELKWMKDKGIVPDGWGKLIDKPKSLKLL